MKKRRQEIIDAGIEYTLQNRPMCMGGDAFFEDMREMNRNRTYEEAAKWADKTMIEKAVKWMKEQVYQEYGGGPLERLIPDERIEDFRKAMEE